MTKSMSGISAALIAFLFVVAGLASAAPDTSVDPLIGVWEAKLRFGPDIKGPLTITRTREGWTADIAGRRVTAPAGAKVDFQLPNDDGGFRGMLNARGDAIDGHWIQRRTTFNGTVYATPVRLVSYGPDRWQGEVAPLDDAMTLYLKIEAGEKGAARVFLRNPERNVGVFVNLTRLTRDGDNVHLFRKQEDNEREIVTGTFDSENDQIRLPIPSLGGTYDFVRGGDTSGFFPRNRQAARYVYRPPQARDDGWSVGSLDGAGISRPGIEAFVQKLIDMPIDSVHASDIHGFLLARHGKLLVEEYFHGFHRDVLHDTRSAAKSVTSTLAGAAISAGFRLDASTSVYGAMSGDKIPNGIEPRKRTMTIEHLLTMSSGFNCDDANSEAPGNEDVMQSQAKEPDWYRYALALPMVSDPGAASVYCSTNANLLGGVINRVTGQPLDSLFARLVAGPLGIKRYAMNLTPTGEPYMGGGIHFAPRDFMKFGQLMLNKGKWNSKRVLSEAWAVRAGSPLQALRDIHYGYFWWVADLPYKGRTVRASFAGGNGGQVVMVVAELDLVIAFFGGNYGDKVLYIPQRVFVPEFILPAVDE